MATLELIKNEFPLHWLVWNNSYQELQEEVSKKVYDVEKLDPRGRTPLVLAITLGHVESTRVLLDGGANVNCENRDGWSVVQEAVSSGDPELVALVVGRRDLERSRSRAQAVPLLLSRLHTAPDFYVEMKWEFTSWMPLVSRMCPHDTYRVFKRGASVRIDTTLLGFEDSQWQRGNRTYIFKGQGNTASMMELDHDSGQVWTERLPPSPLPSPAPVTPRQVEHRLTAPIAMNYIDTEKISFERNKSGIWGWRSDKAENVNGWDCKVFGASNVELVTRTRTEHLSQGDKARVRGPRTPLHSLLGLADAEERGQAQAEEQVGDEQQEFFSVGNPCNISAEEYFSDEELDGRDIGRPREVNTRIQKFRATLWLCESYPLQLQEQIMPILDLMASMSSPHFAKLKDFIQMQLPSGFPVKIEIPLFHVLNARITFGNIYAEEQAIPHVSCVTEGDRQTCIIDDEVFQVPPEYSVQGDEDRRQHSFEDEDDLLQYAIQQSLIDAGSEKDEVDIWEALRAQRPSTPNLLSDEDRQLQRRFAERRSSTPGLGSTPYRPSAPISSPSPSPYLQVKAYFTTGRRLPRTATASPNLKAIQASLECWRGGAGPSTPPSSPEDAESGSEQDEELRRAVLLSRREEQERLQEEAQLAAILELSLLDK